MKPDNSPQVLADPRLRRLRVFEAPLTFAFWMFSPLFFFWLAGQIQVMLFGFGRPSSNISAGMGLALWAAASIGLGRLLRNPLWWAYCIQGLFTSMAIFLMWHYFN